MRAGIMLTLLVGLLSLGPQAEASRGYSAVYFLGDSEVDTGNWLLDDELEAWQGYDCNVNVPCPERGYWRGRWQSARSFSDYFAAALGHDATASLAGGNNYGYGVAWQGPLASESPPSPTSLAGQQMLYASTQVSRLLSDKGDSLDRNALYVIAFTGNDFSWLYNRTSEAAERADMLVAQLQRMVDHGASEFLITLPGTLGMPSGAVKVARETYVAGILEGIATLKGANVATVSRDGHVISGVLQYGTYAQFLASLGLDASLTTTCHGNASCMAAATAAALADEEYRDSAHPIFDNVHSDTKLLEDFADFALYRLRTQKLPAKLTASVLEVPDTDGNGTANVAAFRVVRWPGSGPGFLSGVASMAADVRDGSDGALRGTLPFLNDTFIPAAAEALPDTNGDSVAEIAVLGVRVSDGSMMVQVRNVDGSGQTRNIWFATDHTPVALAVIGDDADNDGVPELAVLSHRNSDRRIGVQVKNATGPANTQTIWGPVGYFARDLEIVPDANGDGVPEIALLTTRLSDGRTLVQVRNATTGSSPYSVWFANGQTPIDLAVVPDKNGDSFPEVGVLSSRNSDGRVLVELRNAAGPSAAPQFMWLPAGYTGIALQPASPSGGDSIPEVAALVQRDSDGAILVSVRNANGTEASRSIWYPDGFSPLGLEMLDDLDGNGVEEAAVLMTRNTDGRVLVQSRNTSGVLAPRSIWFDTP